MTSSSVSHKGSNSPFDPLWEIKELRQWTMFIRAKPKKGTTRSSKVPYRVTNPGSYHHANHKDPATWGRFEEAQRHLEDPGYGFDGVLFALTPPYLGTDLDDCWDTAAGTWSEKAMDYVRRINSYTEISPSGKGLRIIAKGDIPRNREGNKDDGIALWKEHKFLSITGRTLPGYDMEPQERTDVFTEIYHKLETKAGKSGDVPVRTSNLRIVKKGDPPSDEDVMILARQWAKEDRTKDLLEGNAGQYRKDDGDIDYSSADFAWLLLICRHTDDEDQIDRLYQLHGPGHDEWANRNGYRARTLKNVRDQLVRDQAKADAKAESRDGLSGLDNALRFVRLFENELRWVVEEDCWYWWDGRLWRRDASKREHVAMRKAADAIADMYLEVANTVGSEWSSKLAAHARRTKNERPMREMVNLSKEYLITPFEDFDRDDYLLNAMNGTIDLRTGALQKHRREDFITYMVPVEYDPGATLPPWTSFLQGVTNNDDSVEKFLQQAYGSAITGDTGEEKLFFIHGPGGTGKSTMNEAVKRTLGDYAATADFESFIKSRHGTAGQARGDIARLVHKRMVSSVEVDAGKELAEGMVKQVTGNDTITTRFKWKDEFETKPKFTLFLYANDKLTIKAGDSGMWRRMVLVPFDNVIPEALQDSSLKKTLTNPSLAGAAILAWLVQGCLEWQKNGKLVMPPVIKEATTEYRNESNVLAPFLEEKIIREEGIRTQAKLVFETYKTWATNRSFRVLNLTRFGDALADANITKETKGGKVWYLNIRIRTAADADIEPDVLNNQQE